MYEDFSSGDHKVLLSFQIWLVYIFFHWYILRPLFIMSALCLWWGMSKCHSSNSNQLIVQDLVASQPYTSIDKLSRVLVTFVVVLVLIAEPQCHK